MPIDFAAEFEPSSTSPDDLAPEQRDAYWFWAEGDMNQTLKLLKKRPERRAAPPVESTLGDLFDGGRRQLCFKRG
eukprot:4108461-Pyramimonas_sp.AAC.1